MVAVRLVDPRELELPDAGVIVVEDAETGEQLIGRHQRPRVPPPASATAGEEREVAVRRRARRAGVDLHDISTEDDLVRALVRIVERRRRRRR